MKTYRYISDTVVEVVDEDGLSRMSGLASALVPEGVTPAPLAVTEPTPAELLARLDADNVLTQRNLRDTIMLMSEAFRQISAGAVDFTQLPGVAKVYAVEEEAAVLRAQL